jgi:signal transduction histidine kinase
MMWDVRRLVFLLIWVLSVSHAVAQTLTPIELDDFVTTREISERLLRHGDFEGEISRDQVLARLDEFKPINPGPILVETELGASLFLMRVVNSTDTTGDWVFTTRRHTINRLAIYDLTERDPVVLVDSASGDDNPLNIRRFIGYGDVLQLEPGEERLLAVYADLEMLRAIPLEFYRLEAYLDEYYWQTSRFSFVLPSIFILILINVLFFAFLGRPYFLFLAASELSYLILIMHAAAYVDAFGFANYPIAAIQVAEIAKCCFIIFMALFARSMLETRTEYPLLHRALQILMGIGLGLLVFWLCAGLVDKETRLTARSITWMYSAGGSIIFPIAGWLAVMRYGNHYIPLVIGWSAVAIVGLYICAFILFPPLLGLPRFVTLLSVIGFQEAFFVTLSAVWKTWNDQTQQQRTVEEYAAGLEEKIRAISRARELEEVNALAASTIQDQNAMLQSSGHDTKQVLLAINSATEYLEKSDTEQDDDLVGTLKASSAYLEDILSTTLTARRTYTTDRTSLALSAFSFQDLCRSLERIYRPAFSRKNLKFEHDFEDGIQLISDRALLMRALSNFIANALQATTAGGVTCAARTRSGEIEITISDTGTGIDEVMLAYLLADAAEESPAPYDQERPLSGFRIAKSILEQLHGRLVVDTELGKGTTIQIFLPCAFKTLTPIEWSDLQKTDGYVFTDLDRDEIAPDADREALIGITFDDSAQMRSRSAELVALVLYKPLVREVIEHPSMIALKSARSNAPSQ